MEDTGNMKNRLKETPAALLREKNCTCVICGEGVEILCYERGVRPLLELLRSGRDFSGCSAADRVVGKAAAYLYVLLKIREVSAGVISRAAVEVFDRYSIAYSFERMVPAIRNRTGTGFCPMESAVREIDDPAAVPAILEQALKKLSEESERNGQVSQSADADE